MEHLQENTYLTLKFENQSVMVFNQLQFIQLLY